MKSRGIVTDVSNPDGLSPYSNVTVVELKFGKTVAFTRTQLVVMLSAVTGWVVMEGRARTKGKV
jgi:hypothetical protein